MIGSGSTPLQIALGTFSFWLHLIRRRLGRDLHVLHPPGIGLLIDYALEFLIDSFPVGQEVVEILLGRSLEWSGRSGLLQARGSPPR